MILFAIAAAFLIVTAIVELLFPGALVYHDLSRAEGRPVAPGRLLQLAAERLAEPKP